MPDSFKENDRYTLHYFGKKFPYIVKYIDGEPYLLHDSDTPLGVPMTTIPASRIGEYKFTKD